MIRPFLRLSAVIAALAIGSTSFAQSNLSLWGMTRNGGSHVSNLGYSQGTLYQYNPASGAFAKMYDFDNNGNFPYGSLLYYNSKLYGMASTGGTNNAGILFSFDPVTNTYTKLKDVDLIGGYYPTGSLTAYNGKLYGMTHNGGNTGSGLIFEYDPIANTLTKKYDFADATGGNPGGTLVMYNNQLWGVTGAGGANFNGELFSYDPATAIYSPKVSFSTNTGMIPDGDLLMYNGLMYGTASISGANDRGTIYKYDPGTNSLTDIYDFDGITGGAPNGNLTVFNSKMYGLASVGGTNSEGVIFQFDPAGNTYTKIHDFNSTAGDDFPYGSLLLYNNKLYGTTSGGGTYDSGSIFVYDLIGSTYTKLHDFDGPNGATTRYGMLTAAPGSLGVSMMPSVTIADVYPNPANETLTITLKKQQPATFQLMDVTGTMISTKTITSGNNNMDVRVLPAGMYQYRVVDAAGMLLQQGKVTKN